MREAAVSREDDLVGRAWLLAGMEAAELGSPIVDLEHLLAAVTRPELGGDELLESVGVSARRARDFVMFLSGVNEATVAASEHRPYERTAKMQRDPAPVVEVTPEARNAVVSVVAEAGRAGQELSAAHLLIACAPLLVSFGVTANDIRRRYGLALPSPPDLAPRPLVQPRKIGPLVLGGGGDEVAPAVTARLGPSPTAVYLGAAHPERPGVNAWGRAWAGYVDVVDSGLYQPEDADESAIVDRIRAADIVLVAGGTPRALFETLTAGEALDALVEASDGGAVVATTSASAHLLGSVTVDYGADGFEPVPTLGWLPRIAVSTHHRHTAEELSNLRRWLWPHLTDERVLFVPEAGVIWVEPGWTSFATIVDGPNETGAAWWVAPDQPLEPITSAGSSPGSSPGP